MKLDSIFRKCGFEVTPYIQNEHRLVTYAVDYDVEKITLYQKCLQVGNEIIDLEHFDRSVKFGCSITARRMYGGTVVVIGDSMYSVVTVFFVYEIGLEEPRHLLIPGFGVKSFGLASYFAGTKLVIKGVEGRKIVEVQYDVDKIMDCINRGVIFQP